MRLPTLPRFTQPSSSSPSIALMTIFTAFDGGCFLDAVAVVLLPLPFSASASIRFST